MFSLEDNQKWVNESHIPLLTTDDVVRNAKGDYIISLDSLEQQIPSYPTEEYPYIYPFENAYINTSDCGLVKILEVKYEYEIEDKKKVIAIDAEGFVKAILKDVLSDKTDLMVMD